MIYLIQGIVVIGILILLFLVIIPVYLRFIGKFLGVGFFEGISGQFDNKADILFNEYQKINQNKEEE
jgi:hypothetical protein